MGMDASAYLVFGKPLPYGWDDDLAAAADADALDERLEGSPLALRSFGYYAEPTWVLTVRPPAGEHYPRASWDGAKALEGLPKDPDITQVVNAQKMARHLGLLGDDETFGWVLAAAYG
jgi:hypothetical protein